MLQRIIDWLRIESENVTVDGGWARLFGRWWAQVNYATQVEPTWLELNHHDVPIRGLGQSFCGTRIVQLSDLHCSHRVTTDYLARAVDMAQSQQGDVIVLTGDFVHKGFKYIDRMARVLGRLSSPHGVYAVLGNHDFSVRNAMGVRRYPDLHRAVAEALRSQGIIVLQNQTIRLTRGNEHLHLTGVEDLWSRVCDVNLAFEGICPSVPRVVLAHNPCTVEELADHRCDLMLSGHTHGGQVSLPGLGPVGLHGKARRYAAGLYQLGDTFLYVNKGVGFGSFPIRYGVRPEVAVLTLRAT